MSVCLASRLGVGTAGEFGLELGDDEVGCEGSDTGEASVAGGLDNLAMRTWA